VNYFFISLFHFLFIKANIRKHDTKDKEMICIIIVGNIVISFCLLYILSNDSRIWIVSYIGM